MNASLVFLTFRRVLGGGFVWLFALVALAAANADWAPPLESLRDLLGAERPGGIAYALTLRGVWSLMLLATVPWVVFRAAAIVPRWRRGEIDWLASAPVSRGHVALSAAAGLVFALVPPTAGVTALAEYAATRTAGVAARIDVRRGASLPAPTAVLDQHVRPVTLEVAPGAADQVRGQLFVVGGGNAAHVRMTLVRGEQRRSVEARVAARTELRAPVPPGRDPLRIELERLGPGPIVALAGGSLETLEHTADRSAASVELMGRALLALLAWTVLAFGLGAWVSAPLAGLLTLSLALLSFAASGGPSVFAALPGADLPGALALIGQGVVPARPTPGALASAALTAAAGLGLARTGLARWRRP